MAKENRILAIDVGGETLKMAEFLIPETGGAFQLTGFLFRKMVRQEEESDQSLFARTYYEMLAEGHFTAKFVRLALSAQNSFQRLSKRPPMLGSRSSINRLIEYEASQTVPYAMNEVEWDYQLLHHQWEENVKRENEDGTVAQEQVHREEYEALFVAMKTEDVVQYTDIIEDSGKKLLSVEIASVALFNAAVATQISEDECVLLLNIGGKATSLMISDHRRLFMRNIPIGGDNITLQIKKEFNVPNAEAEDFKKRYSFVALGGAYEDPESELAATISKLARNVMTRLHGEVSRSISVWRAQHGGSAPTRVLLCGGGSTLLYTADFFQEKLRLPTEYLNTFSLVNIGPDVNRDQLQAVAPMFQGLIGLALRSIGNCPIDISLLPKNIKKQLELDTKKPYFYASAAALISCLLIFALGVTKLLAFEQKRVKAVDIEVKRAEQEVARIKKVDGELQAYIGKYTEATQLLLDRKKWGALMDELQSKIPETMWLTSLEFLGDKKIALTNTDASAGMDTMMDAPAEPTAQKEVPLTGMDICNLQEINKIRIKGYVLNIPGVNDALVPALRASLSQGKLFDQPKIIKNENAQNNNLKYLEIVLALKEPIKK